MDDLYQATVASKEDDDEDKSQGGCTMFQMMQAQNLIGMLEKKFPPIQAAGSESGKNVKSESGGGNAGKANVKVEKTGNEIKTENWEKNSY